MFTLHTRLALIHRSLTPPAQRTFYTGDILLSSDLIKAGAIYRSHYSIFRPGPTVIPNYLEPYDYPPPYDMVERWQRVPRYTFTLEELTLAESWHGGQYTMLYALASTGNLTPSRLPPRWYQNHTDLYHALYYELRAELITITLRNPDHPDVILLANFTDRVTHYINRIEPRTTNE